MIRSFADRATERVFLGTMPKGFPNEAFNRARRVLERLNAAHEVMDLRFPPSHRLEKLQGDRKGFWSVRVNDQFRITFRFKGNDAFDVRFEDYH
jgi:proteic killer suppression protein